MNNFASKCSHIINIFDKETEPPKDKGNLYLSGVYSLKEQQELKNIAITCVLSIIDEYSYNKFRVGEKVKQLSIKEHKWIDLNDDDNLTIYPYLEDAHSYIKAMLQEHNVLVHCQGGISRSASLVIAFLMKQYGMDYCQAKSETQKKRKLAQPNEGFELDLKKFQIYLNKNTTNLDHQK